MTNSLSALLIHANAVHMARLGLVLQQASIDVHEASSFGEVIRALECPRTFDFIFTDTAMSDGDWKDVLALARQSGRNVGVVVASRTEDSHLSERVAELGAAGVIAPPFDLLSLVLSRLTRDKAC